MIGWMLKSSSSHGLCLICTRVRQASVRVCRSPSARADPRAQRRAGGAVAVDGGHAGLPSRLRSVVLGRVAGQGQEDLVEAGAAQRQLGDARTPASSSRRTTAGSTPGRRPAR